MRTGVHPLQEEICLSATVTNDIQTLSDTPVNSVCMIVSLYFACLV